LDKLRAKVFDGVDYNLSHPWKEEKRMSGKDTAHTAQTRPSFQEKP
jgi:hypothetical protein